MDIEIYAICCSHDLKKINSSSSYTAPYLSDKEAANMLNKVTTDTSPITLCAHNVIELPQGYKLSLSTQEAYHSFSYHDLRDTANIPGCYVIIGSENIKTLRPMEQYLLSQNILMKGRRLEDIIKSPETYTQSIHYTTKEEVTHVHKHSNGIKAPTEHSTDDPPAFNACNLCTIS